MATTTATESTQKSVSGSTNRRGKLVEYPVYYVNCGSWVKSYAENAKITHYAERKGYTRQARKAPLIKISAKNSGGLVSLSYSVET